MHGPTYQVVRACERRADGDWMMLIRVLHTEEELPYRLSAILDDPREA